MRASAVFLASLLLFAAVANNATAETERRVALVIGNGAYASVPKLPNPQADATFVAAALREAGFAQVTLAQVTLAQDLTRDQLYDALRTFAAEAERSDWAVLYYAGHGIEFGGVNYLIPIDAHLATDRDVQFEAVPLPQALAAAEAAHKLRLVILDACRDNPFLNQMKRSVGTRSVGRGLARVEPESGTLVAYAARDGHVALDGEGGNSPFAAALVRRLRTPGLEINKLFRYVRSDVLAATNNQQEPFVYGSLPPDDFYFVPIALPTIVGEPAPAGATNKAASTPGPSPREASLQGPSVVIGGATASVKPSDPEPHSSLAPTLIPPKAPLQQSILVSIQNELQRIGCGPVEGHGHWGPMSRSALEQFGRYAHAAIPAAPDNLLLDRLREQRVRVCPLTCAEGFSVQAGRCVVQACPRGQVRDSGGACSDRPRSRPVARRPTPDPDPSAVNTRPVARRPTQVRVRPLWRPPARR